MLPPLLHVVAEKDNGYLLHRYPHYFFCFHFVASRTPPSRLGFSSSCPPLTISILRPLPTVPPAPYTTQRKVLWSRGTGEVLHRVLHRAASMGPSGKWFKSLVALKAPEKSVGHKGGRKWARLWRSSSSVASRASAGDGSALASEASSASADSFSSVLAAVVRAPPRDFRLIRQEWAAVRIQTAFRAFLVSPGFLLCFGITATSMLVCDLEFLTPYASVQSCGGAGDVSRRGGR